MPSWAFHMELQNLTRRSFVQLCQLVSPSLRTYPSEGTGKGLDDPSIQRGPPARMFFPEHFKREGELDDSLSIQRAIDTAYEQRGSQLIALGGTYRCRTPLTLKPGTILDGSAAAGYYAGRQHFWAADVGYPGCRLVATDEISGGLLRLRPEPDVNRGYDIRNVTVDANQRADHCLYFEGAAGSIRESSLRLTDVSLQGAQSDGVRLAAISVVRTLRMTISACNGFGFNAAYGVSDSEHIGAYIHTCSKGGVHVGEGSIGLRFIGGKIEDNYGNNLEIFTEGPDALTQVYLLGVSVQMGNANGLNVDGGTVYVSGGCWFMNHHREGTAAIRCQRGVVHVSASRFDGNFVNLLASGNGRIVSAGNDFHPAISRDFICSDHAHLTVSGGLVDGLELASAKTENFHGGQSVSLTFDQINPTSRISNFGVVRNKVSVLVFNKGPASPAICSLSGELFGIFDEAKTLFHFETVENIAKCGIQALSFSERNGKLKVEISFISDGVSRGYVSVWVN